MVSHVRGHNDPRRPTSEKRNDKMKTQLISAKSPAAARKLAPWAAKVAKVEGGYMAFESAADYRTWKNQK